MRVEVESHARLHFGFLDPSGERGRRFGGMGMAVSRPRFLLTLEPAATLSVEGEEAERVERLAARFLEGFDLPPGARIRVVEAIPAHVGLGSGTQLALSLAAGLNALHRLDIPIAELCGLMGRARRSGVGYHLFRRGGFVVEGGHATDERRSAAPPLLLRLDFPDAWRVVVAIPGAALAPSGEAEDEAFRRLGPAPDEAVDRIARLILMHLLPALVERELRAFGAALAQVQDLVGDCFAAVQEGPFHPAGGALVRRLREAGACGVGQSSWGPAVYALAADETEEERIVDLLKSTDPAATILTTRGWNQGAAIQAG
jgi:beta-RFAP synthase